MQRQARQRQGPPLKVDGLPGASLGRRLPQRPWGGGGAPRSQLPPGADFSPLARRNSLPSGQQRAGRLSA